MTTRVNKIEFESIILILIAAMISGFFVLMRSNSRFNLGSLAVTQQLTQPTPSPTPVPKTATVSQVSSDGKKKLIMKVITNSDYTQTYTFFAQDINGTNQQFIFKQTVEATDTMGIPFNSWSPDDKYFFIVKHSPTKEDVLVFNSSGVPFSQTESYYDATDIFNNKETGYVFDEATGWASETLIIINTKAKDGSKGPSFWFEVPSKAVIQLSTEF